jgi:hypothetical protein
MLAIGQLRMSVNAHGLQEKLKIMITKCRRNTVTPQNTPGFMSEFLKKESITESLTFAMTLPTG